MNELAVIEHSDNFIAPVASLEVALGRYQSMKEFINRVLVDGVDFGVIPGTDKPTLYKPGAEKLTTFFGLSVAFETIERQEDWTGSAHDGEPFFYYWYKCTITRNGKLIAEGEGSANSFEKKYRYRSASLVCPTCGKETIIKGRDEYGGGWLCFAKKGGCGAKFKDGDKSIENQPRGQVKNPDIADVVNTLQKMAQKRAFVAAVLIATNASEYFTQDIEDFVIGEFVEVVQKQEEQPAVTISDEKPVTPSIANNPFDSKSEDDIIAIGIEKLKSFANEDKPATENQRKLLRHLVDDVVFQDDDAHHVLFQYLYGDESIKTVNGGAVRGLIDWMNPVQNSAGEYSTDRGKQLHAVMRYIQKENGQLELISL